MTNLDLKRPCIHPNGAVTYTRRMEPTERMRIINCPCDDGQRRTVYIVSDQDPFHTPARVSVRGRTVPGYVEHLILLSEGPRFHAFAGGKNAGLINPSPYRDEEVIAHMILGKRHGDPPAARVRRLFRSDFPLDDRGACRQQYGLIAYLRGCVGRMARTVKHYVARLAFKVAALANSP